MNGQKKKKEKKKVPSAYKTVPIVTLLAEGKTVVTGSASKPEMLRPAASTF